MEEKELILNMFESQEQWNAYIELARMKNELVYDIQKRLYKELLQIFETKYCSSFWDLVCKPDHLTLFPKGGEEHVGIRIEWYRWNEASFDFYKRSVAIWVNADVVNVTKFKSEISNRNKILPVSDFCESPNNWLPFVRKIPAVVFGVNNETSSFEECIYMAINDPKTLAHNLWQNVFESFANHKCAKILTEIYSNNKNSYT